MRVKLEGGEVVRLLHFQAINRHWRLLSELQMAVPNAIVAYTADDGLGLTHVTPVYRLFLGREVIRQLNPTFG